MKRALKIGMMIEMKHPKNIFAILLVILAIVGSMFYIHTQRMGDQIAEQTGDFYAIQAALSRFQVVDASEYGDGSPIYKNLAQQKTTVSQQLANLKMGKDDRYHRASLKLANLRADIYDMDDFEKVKTNMPSRIQNSLEQVYFSYLVEHDLPISNNTLQYWPFLLFLFSIIGAGWYMLVAFYTSGILLEDYEHSSVVKGYPIAFHTYILSKCITAFSYICIFIALIFIVTLPLLFIEGAGFITYPVAIYIGKAVVIPTWLYILIAILLMLVVAVFVMLFSIILNVWLKNMYLTLFVHTICFFLPQMFTKLVSFIPVNPFNFMQFNQILHGFPLSLNKPVDVTLFHGLILIAIAFAVMLFVVKKYFSIGKISRI